MCDWKWRKSALRKIKDVIKNSGLSWKVRAKNLDIKERGQQKRKILKISEFPIVKWVKYLITKSVTLWKARGEEVCTTCRVGCCGPTVTLSKHGSLAQGLFWDPLVAPGLGEAAQGDPQKHLKLQAIKSKIYLWLSSQNKKLICFPCGSHFVQQICQFIAANIYKRRSHDNVDNF